MPRHLLRLGSVAAAATCLVLLLTTAAAAALSAGNGGWRWQNPLPQGGDYTGGYFLDATHGWLISGGNIFHTSDGGATLTLQARHNVAFHDITFADTEHGWAVGDPSNTTTGTGIVYRTTNGGARWIRVRLQAVGGVSAVSFANAKVGWAACARTVLRTVDGGLHWTIAVRAIRLFNDVQALGPRQAWACGNVDTLVRTDDGGATWQRLSSGTHENLIRIQFTSAGNGWLAGAKTIFHTADGGADWMSQAAIGPTITGLAFADPQDGWVTATKYDWAISDAGPYPVSSGAVYHTSDGGAHWVLQTIPPALSSAWVWAVSPSDAIVGGAGGRLSHTVDGGDSWQSSWRAAADFSGDLDAVQFLNQTTGWTAGSAGEILKTADGGASWAAQTSNTTQDINGLDFVGADNGWAVGDKGAIVHTTDGGATWTLQTSGVGDDLAGVSFVDALHGWAVGGAVDQWGDSSTGVILATVDGGQHWTKQTTPVAAAALNAVAFADALHGWAVGEVVGDSGTNVTVILATKDGGGTWTKQFQHTPPMTGNTSQGVLTSIACIDARHLVAVGSDDSALEIFRTSNGGQRWTRTVPPPSWSRRYSPGLTDVVFADAAHGWAAGGDVILRTADGGVTWTKQSVGPTGALALSFVSRTRGWAVGDAANILTTTTAGDTP